MRKIWILVLIVMLAAFTVAFSQTVHWADQKTVTWDAPTHLSNGNPIPPGDTIAYRTYLKHEDDSVEYIEETLDFPYVVTIPEGVFDFGVCAVRYIPGVSTPGVSLIIWSSDADPPFLLGNIVPPDVPGNLRIP